MAASIEVGGSRFPLSRCLFPYTFGNGLSGFPSAACSGLPVNEAGVLGAHVLESVALPSEAPSFLPP